MKSIFKVFSLTGVVLLWWTASVTSADPAQNQIELPNIDSVEFAGLSPEQAAKEIMLPSGFKAHVFAAEPDVRQPIAFCLDERGRVWVAEAYEYPRRAPEGEGKDRILIFEDTDGDHRFDKRTVFIENLNLISGLEHGFGGVWVGAAPYLMFIPDEDGDDKPDGDPQILLDGWDPYRDTHETLNTFTWGPDGWLYGCHGVFCPSHVGKPGTPEEDRQRVDAAVWRFHPIRHEFEVFAEGTSNPWGIDFDEHGQCFIEACVIPHFWHIIQGARYQRQGGRHYAITLEEKNRVQKHLPASVPQFLNPFIYDDIKTHGDHVHWAGQKGPHAANNRSDSVGGGHAHAGFMFYQGNSWPEKYQNAAFMNNIHGQRINMDVLQRKGSGYVGQHGPDFLNFNDRWSQVMNLLYDQNGSVYVIDWYDANQCHHRRYDGHDRSNGRIYKIVYDEEPWTSVDLSRESDEQLVMQQLNKNEWYASQARKILQHRAAQRPLSEKANQRLMSWLEIDGIQNPPGVPDWRYPAQDSRAQLKLLWTLHVTGGLTESSKLKLLKSDNEYIRAWSIQLLIEDRSPSEATLSAFAQLAKDDPSQFVRLYLAAAMQRTPIEQRAPVLKNLVAHAEDADDHNLPLMYWYALEPVVGSDRTAALAMLSQSRIPVVRQYIARRMATPIQTAAAR